MFRPFLLIGIPIILTVVMVVFLVVRRITMGGSPRSGSNTASIFVVGLALLIFLASATIVFITARRVATMHEPTNRTEGVPLFEFCTDEDTRRLVADVEAGRIPVSCNVLYDQMGGLPDVTITDEATILEIYALLSRIRVGDESMVSITDSYHHVVFTLQDGTTVGWGFEGTGILVRGRTNYDVTGSGPLWTRVRALQNELMENERAAAEDMGSTAGID